MLRDALHDGAVRGQVYAEGLLAHHVLARANDVAVELLVQVVRNRAVHCFHVRVRQDVAVVGRDLLHAVEVLPEPGEHRVAGVADGHDLRAHVHFGQMTPARGRARELPAHQPAADYAEAHRSHHAYPSFACTSAMDSSMMSMAFSASASDMTMGGLMRRMCPAGIHASPFRNAV